MLIPSGNTHHVCVCWGGRSTIQNKYPIYSPTETKRKERTVKGGERKTGDK